MIHNREVTAQSYEGREQSVPCGFPGCRARSWRVDRYCPAHGARVDRQLESAAGAAVPPTAGPQQEAETVRIGPAASGKTGPFSASSREFSRWRAWLGLPRADARRHRDPFPYHN